MTEKTPRLPAEWEPQDAIQLTWPHEDTDWQPLLADVIPIYERLVQLLAQHGHVLIGAPANQVNDLRARLTAQGAPSDRLHIYPVAANDTWARDHGPITVETADGLCLLDYQFTGWGNKYAHDLDNQVSATLFELGAYPGAKLHHRDLVLEGGAIESDGNGTLLTTAQCLLNPNRNPSLSQQEIEQQLRDDLGLRKINWLHHGSMEGDDTDSHIDTLARLCPNNVIAYQACGLETDSHYRELQQMAEELRQLSDADGNPYELVPLPWASPKYDEDGHRLPATYANFLIFNDMVIVPTYRDVQDKEALAQIAKAFPGYRVEGLDCLPIIHQHGSLHCITMQLPKGTLSSDSAQP
ncbi:MAG: agmatine deiminase family protein [Porticoccaceae bacterium]